MRALLEVHIAGLAAERATEEDLARLRDGPRTDDSGEAGDVERQRATTSSSTG